jgi:ketosteroid isomerase-like protein
MNPMAIRDLADRFVAALEAADVAALDALYAPDAVVWHNYDRIEQTRDRNIESIGRFPKQFRSIQFQNIRRSFFEGGFVQQHVAAGIKADGSAFHVPVCMVVTLRGKQIARVDEYFDSAHDARPVGERQA